MRKQIEDWDEPKDFRSETSSDQSNFVDSSLDRRSSDEENSGIKNGSRVDGTQERSGDNNGGYNWRLKVGKMTRNRGGVIRQPQKKVKGDVKQRWKIGFHNQVNVLSLSKKQKPASKIKVKIQERKYEKYNLNHKLEPLDLGC